MVLSTPTVKSAYLVTIVRTILGTALGVIVTACAAYAMACPTLPGEKIFSYVILIPFVFSGGLIPYYLTLFRLGLINTFWVFVLPGLFNIWNMFVMRQFFTEIPESLKEAAIIDGANEYVTLMRIVLPISLPMLAAISLFVAVGHWNSWFDGAFYVSKESLLPLQTYLRRLLDSMSSSMQQNNASDFLNPSILNMEMDMLTFQLAANGVPDSCRSANNVRLSLPAKVFCEGCTDWRSKRLRPVKKPVTIKTHEEELGMKRWLAFLVAAMMLVATVPALGEEVKQWPEIEIWVGEIRDFAEKTKVQEQWSEKLGFNVVVKNQSGDVETALNLALASGGFKDIALIPRNDVWNNAIIRSGTVMEVSEILKDANYPNISGIQQQYLDLCKDSNGKHWYIPTNFDQNPDNPFGGWTNRAFRVRKDLLDKLGMKAEDIKTLADFETYLRGVKDLKDENGNSYIPMTIETEEMGIRVALSAFGVKNGKGSGALIPVDKTDDGFVFEYDHPGYKEAMAWLNRMIREGLMDEESVVQSGNIYKEKIASGMYGANLGYYNLNGTKADEIVRQFEPIPYPAVENVENPGTYYVLDPNPSYAVYISKNTKNLDAILAFLNWSLEQVPERHFELNEGFEGINWHWKDQPYGAWYFDPEYLELRNNPATRTSLQPELFAIGSKSLAWYPWWTQYNEDPQNGLAGCGC